MGQDDGSSSPVSMSFKVNLTGNSFSHKYNVSSQESVWANVVLHASVTLFVLVFSFPSFK